MGCFSVCCSMSKMTINAGDKVLLIPLIPVGPAGGYMYLSTMDLFMPFCLPIVGTYDDYGSIENIEKNINTEMLEKYFNLSIEDIVSVVTDPRSDLYDSLSSTSQAYLQNPEWLSKEYPFEKLLQEVGYKQNGSNAYGNIYRTDYAEIAKDENGEYKVTLFANDKYKYDRDHVIDYFTDLNCWQRNRNLLQLHLAITGEYVGVKDIEKYKLLSSLGGMFVLYDVFEAFSKQNEDELTSMMQGIDKAVSNYQETMEIYNKVPEISISASMDRMYLLGNTHAFYPFRDNEYFLDVYKDIILNKNLSFFEFACKFYEFNIGMYKTNTMYTPMFQGTQCGDEEAELKLHSLCCDILKERIKRYHQS